MPALSFKKQFAEAIENGTKRQTIRQIWKRNNPKVGDTLHLFTGMRTTYCRKLREVTCTEREIVSIDKEDMVIGATRLTGGQCSAMAKADGFSCWDEFVEFFENQYGLPFFGQLIKW